MRWLVPCVLLAGCSSGSYTKMFDVPAPGGAYTARAELRNEGTPGSSRDRVSIERSDGAGSREVFRGTNGWITAPVWQNGSTLIVPFCFGRIMQVDSYLPWKGADPVRFRTSTSTLIHVHVVTAPDTVIAGVSYCRSDEALPTIREKVSG
jgi:hypothetical protein